MSGHRLASPEVPPTDPPCVLSGAQKASGLSNTLPGHTSWRDLTRRTQVPKVRYQSRNGCGHHKPDTHLTQRTLNHHKPWEGSSVPILQVRKLRVREVSHCLRSLNLQQGSEPWAMSAQEPGWEGPMCPPRWPYSSGCGGLSGPSGSPCHPHNPEHLSSGERESPTKQAEAKESDP